MAITSANNLKMAITSAILTITSAKTELISIAHF